MVLKGTLVLLLCRKEPFYSRVPEYQAAHLGFFVFIMEFPTLFSMQELSENLLLPHQSAGLRLTTSMSAHRAVIGQAEVRQSYQE